MTRESHIFGVEAEAAGGRLDEFLAGRLGHLSRLRIARLIRAGECRLNGSLALHAGARLSTGDLIAVEFERGAPSAMTPEFTPLEILYEDAELLVIVKPAGMLVHPTRGVKTGTLANALTYHLNQQTQPFNQQTQSAEGGEQFEAASLPTAIGQSERVRPGIVHRLDRATSGLMVVAKCQRALSILSRHFHLRRVEKRYLAIVEGALDEGERVIRAPIGRLSESPPHWGVCEEGREAETRLRAVEIRDGRSLVELEPVTGRTNQLRIHCAFVGHPIVGDELYGTGEAGARLCLHAARLAFHHPSGGRWMEFESPMPRQLADIFSPV